MALDFPVSPTSGQIYTSGSSSWRYSGTAWVGNTVGTTLGIVSKTADYTIASTESGTTYDNTSATGAVVLTLPTPAKGLTYKFAVTAAQYLRINGTILQGGLSGAYIRSNTPGSYLALEAHDSTGWIVSSIEGGWGLAV